MFERQDRHVQRQHVASSGSRWARAAARRASSSSMPAPASSTNEAAICVTANSRSRRFVPEVMRTPPLATAEAARAVARRQARHEGEQHRRRQRQHDARPRARWRPPSGRAPGPRSAPRSARARRPSAARAATPRIAPAPHSSRLSASSVRRSAARLAPSAARIAQLPFTPNRPGEDQVRHVRAGDHEHERGGGQQHQQHGPRGRRDLVAQADGVDAEIGVARIGLRVRLHDRAVGRPQFGPRRLDDPRPAPSARTAPSSGGRARPPSWRRDDAGW